LGEGEEDNGWPMTARTGSIAPRCIYHDSALPAMNPGWIRSNANGDYLHGWRCVDESCDGFFSSDLGYLLGTTPQSVTATEVFLATKCRTHDSPRFAFREAGGTVEFACTESECGAGTVTLDKSTLSERP
jgi:hypothetical protein